MTKKTYIATFADGETITRKTERKYVIAWRIRWTRKDGGNSSMRGFSANPNFRPALPTCSLVYRHMNPIKRDVALKANADYQKNANIVIETVQVMEK